MICPNPKCQKEIEDDSVFCEFCGERVDFAPSEEEKKMKMWRNACWVLIVALVSCCIGSFILHNKTSDSVDESSIEQVRILQQQLDVEKNNLKKKNEEISNLNAKIKTLQEKVDKKGSIKPDTNLEQILSAKNMEITQLKDVVAKLKIEKSTLLKEKQNLENALNVALGNN